MSRHLPSRMYRLHERRRLIEKGPGPPQRHWAVSSGRAPAGNRRSCRICPLRRQDLRFAAASHARWRAWSGHSARTAASRAGCGRWSPQSSPWATLTTTVSSTGRSSTGSSRRSATHSRTLRGVRQARCRRNWDADRRRAHRGRPGVSHGNRPRRARELAVRPHVTWCLAPARSVRVGVGLGVARVLVVPGLGQQATRPRGAGWSSPATTRGELGRRRRCVLPSGPRRALSRCARAC